MKKNENIWKIYTKMWPKQGECGKKQKWQGMRKGHFETIEWISYINLKLETGKHDEKFGNSAQKKGETKNGVIWRQQTKNSIGGTTFHWQISKSTEPNGFLLVHYVYLPNVFIKEMFWRWKISCWEIFGSIIETVIFQIFFQNPSAC